MENINSVLLKAKKYLINNAIKSHNLNLSNYKIIHTTENVLNDDTANIIMRNRKDSSISQGLNYIKKATGFIRFTPESYQIIY